MNRAGMAQFLERLGHRVAASESCYWYDLRPRFCLAIPHTQPVFPEAGEIRRVLAATGAVGLRHLAPLDGPGRLSYALIVDDPAYDIEQLSSNTRSKVRRGLRNCTVGRETAEFVRSRGRAANDDTLARLRFTNDFYPWDRYWDAVAATSGAEVWVATHDGELASYLVVLIVEGCAEILVARSRSELLKYYPNNAVLFAAVHDLIRRDDIESVLFGLESLETVSGVDQFKESMGFQHRPVRQRIVLHPVAERLLRLRLVRRAADAWVRRRPESEFWRKVEGVLAFHDSVEDGRGPREDRSCIS